MFGNNPLKTIIKKINDYLKVKRINSLERNICALEFLINTINGFESITDYLPGSLVKKKLYYVKELANSKKLLEQIIKRK